MVTPLPLGANPKVPDRRPKQTCLNPLILVRARQPELGTPLKEKRTRPPWVVVRKDLPYFLKEERTPIGIGAHLTPLPLHPWKLRTRPIKCKRTPMPCRTSNNTWRRLLASASLVNNRLIGLVIKARGAWKLRETPAKKISPVRAVLLSRRDSRTSRLCRLLNPLCRLLSRPPRLDNLSPNWPPEWRDPQMISSNLVINNRTNKSLHTTIRRAVISERQLSTCLPSALTPRLSLETRAARSRTTRVPAWLIIVAPTIAL